MELCKGDPAFGAGEFECFIDLGGANERKVDAFPNPKCY